MYLRGDVDSRQQGFAFAILETPLDFVKANAVRARFSGMTRDRRFGYPNIPHHSARNFQHSTVMTTELT
jgi:hypothetical protein